MLSHVGDTGALHVHGDHWCVPRCMYRQRNRGIGSLALGCGHLQARIEGTNLPRNLSGRQRAVLAPVVTPMVAVLDCLATVLLWPSLAQRGPRRAGKQAVSWSRGMGVWDTSGVGGFGEWQGLTAPLVHPGEGLPVPYQQDVPDHL